MAASPRYSPRGDPHVARPTHAQETLCPPWARLPAHREKRTSPHPCRLRLQSAPVISIFVPDRQHTATLCPVCRRWDKEHALLRPAGSPRGTCVRFVAMPVACRACNPHPPQAPWHPCYDGEVTNSPSAIPHPTHARRSHAPHGGWLHHEPLPHAERLHGSTESAAVSNLEVGSGALPQSKWPCPGALASWLLVLVDDRFPTIKPLRGCFDPAPARGLASSRATACRPHT